MKLLAGLLAAMAAVFVVAVLAASDVIDLPGDWRAKLGFADEAPAPPCRPGLYRTHTASPPAPSGHWREEPEAPRAQIEGSAVGIGPVVYTAGGARPGNLHTMLAYDTRSHHWSAPTHLPVGLNHAQAVTHDGKLYLAGGYLEGEAETDEFWEYDPGTNHWKQLAPMPLARGAAGAAVIGDKLYVFGGAKQIYYVDDPGRPYDELDVYDFDTGEWSRGPDAPISLHHVAATALGGKLYTAGGRVDPQRSSAAFLSYDPKTATWEQLPDLPEGPTSSMGAASAGGRVVVLGGDDELDWEDGGGSVSASVWAYDPSSRGWARLPDLVVERHAFGTAVAGGRIYAITGGYCPGLRPNGPVVTHRVESLPVNRVRDGEPVPGA